MTIIDPTAIPETDADIQAYLTAADDYWSNGRHTEAATLYWSCIMSDRSSSLPGERQGEILLRHATVMLESGDVEAARRSFRWGANNSAECKTQLDALDAATEDQTVDPDTIPQTREAAAAYTEAAAAVAESDPERAAALYRAVIESPVITPHERGSIAYELGMIYQRGGSHDAAYSTFVEAAATGFDNVREQAVKAIAQYQRQDGTDHDGLSTSGHPTDEEDVQRYVQGAIDAYDRGDTGRCEALAMIVNDSTVSTTAQRGAVRYYLGMMAYYADNYDVARTHLEAANTQADEPYKSWAADLLRYLYQGR